VSGSRSVLVRLALVSVLLPACAQIPPEEARTRADFCFWFDRFLDVLEDGDATRQEVDEATEDLITAGLAFGIQGEAPGIRQEIERFAAALDAGDQAAIDGFINNTLAYCEDLLEPV
jgi:hypothetical protein